MVQGKSKNDIEYDCIEYNVKLSNELWKELIDRVGRESFRYSIEKLPYYLNTIEHEHSIENKNAFLIEKLNNYKANVLKYYTIDRFPKANMDYNNIKVEVFRRDIEYLFPVMFNAKLYTNWAPRISNPKKVIGSFKDINIVDLEKFRKLLREPFEEIAEPEFDNKLHNKNDNNNEPISLIYKLGEIFGDIVIYTELHKLLKNSLNTESPKEEIYNKTKEITTKGKPYKPVFKTEAIDRIFEILKGYFSTQQNELKQVLVTGNIPDEKLSFNGNGKTLLDFFKQLIIGQFLIVNVQRDFENWVSNSFDYYYRNKITNFSPKYASLVISGNVRASKGNRLINVQNKNGIFEIVQLEIRNREQN
jgi:hypothetical protein